jgi:hypothetical protein
MDLETLRNLQKGQMVRSIRTGRIYEVRDRLKDGRIAASPTWEDGPEMMRPAPGYSRPLIGVSDPAQWELVTETEARQ